MSNDPFVWREFSDLPSVERIRELVQQKGAMARQVGMDFGEGIVVSDSDDAVSISGSPNGTLTLRFGNKDKPAYRLVVRTDGVIKVACTAEPPALDDQIALMWRLPVVFPERSVFGVVGQEAIHTIFMTGEFVFNEGIYYPPGLDGYVLQGHTMLRTLRVSQDPTNEEWSRWFDQFYLGIKHGAIFRLSERIWNFPTDIFAVWQNRQASLLIEGSDGRTPPIAEGRYDFWHPREEYPGQLSIVDWGEEDVKYSIREWVA